MVFQKPNPFPKSIYDNIAYGPRVTGMKVDNMDDLVEEALRGAALWDEVKDKLKQSAYGLSGGQQQRLCIARTIATKPDVILMDEPCSALDPIATARIEDLMLELRDDYTIIIVTHNMQQAARVSDRTAFFTARPDETTGNRTGLLVEFDQTAQIFSNPERQAHRGLHLRPLRLSLRRVRRWLGQPAVRSERSCVRTTLWEPCSPPYALSTARRRATDRGAPAAPAQRCRHRRHDQRGQSHRTAVPRRLGGALNNTGASPVDISGWVVKDSSEGNNVTSPRCRHHSCSGCLYTIDVSSSRRLVTSARLFADSRRSVLIDSWTAPAHAPDLLALPRRRRSISPMPPQAKNSTNVCVSDRRLAGWHQRGGCRSPTEHLRRRRRVSGLAYEGSGSAAPGTIVGGAERHGTLYKLTKSGARDGDQWRQQLHSSTLAVPACRTPRASRSPSAGAGRRRLRLDRARRDGPNSGTSRPAILRYVPTGCRRRPADRPRTTGT